MIGNAARRVHAEQADQDHARRVEPDAERHQRAEHEVAGDADAEQRAVQAERVAAGREQAEQPSASDQRGGRQQRHAHADLDVAPRPAPRRCRRRATRRPPTPRSARPASSLDLDDRDEDERLRDRRQRVADVERAGDHWSGTSLQRAEHRRRRRERADAERVEEVGDEADRERERAGQRPERTLPCAPPGPTAATNTSGHQAEGERRGSIWLMARGGNGISEDMGRKP